MCTFMDSYTSRGKSYVKKELEIVYKQMNESSKVPIFER